MGNEDISLEIVKKLIKADFEYSKVQKLNPDISHILNNIDSISKSLLSYYKVTFVEEGIDKIDTVSICILLSFISFLNGSFKNLNTDSKIKSLDRILELLDILYPYFKTKRWNLLNYEY
jgi:hypothetical protein